VGLLSVPDNVPEPVVTPRTTASAISCATLFSVSGSIEFHLPLQYDECSSIALHPNGLAVASYRKAITDRRYLLRRFALFASAAVFFFLASFASAQQGDAMFGFGTLMSPGAASCNFNTGCPEKGGLYPNVGGDVIFHKRIGFGFDVSWRGSQGNYGGTGLPYRPILYDFNAVYQPRLTKNIGVDLMAGIGGQSTRFYSANYSCNFFSCTNYTSSNHFLEHIGGGIRYYVWGHVFVRPEIHYYHINNNTVDFTSGNVVRAGASIGYTIGPE
jgi:Outer membrane protein beta-barrel domain